MTDYVWLLMLGMVANFVTIFVMFLPPADKVFHNHPECSLIEFSPDYSTKIKQLCRDARKTK